VKRRRKWDRSKSRGGFGTFVRPKNLKHVRRVAADRGTSAQEKRSVGPKNRRSKKEELLQPIGRGSGLQGGPWKTGRRWAAVEKLGQVQRTISYEFGGPYRGTDGTSFFPGAVRTWNQLNAARRKRGCKRSGCKRLQMTVV